MNEHEQHENFDENTEIMAIGDQHGLRSDAEAAIQLGWSLQRFRTYAIRKLQQRTADPVVFDLHTDL